MKFFRLFIVAGLAWALISPCPAAAVDCAEDFVCHEALVKFSRRLPPEAIHQVLAESHAEILAYHPRTRLYHLAFPAVGDTLKQISELKSHAGVLLAAPNYRVSAQALPNDAQFNLLWGLKNTGQTGGLAG